MIQTTMPSTASTTQYFYYGGSSILTITIPPGGTNPGSVIQVTPVPTAGISDIVLDPSTVTEGWSGSSTRTVTLFTAKPMAGIINHGIVVILTPTHAPSQPSTAPSPGATLNQPSGPTQPSQQPPASSNAGSTPGGPPHGNSSPSPAGSPGSHTPGGSLGPSASGSQASPSGYYYFGSTTSSIVIQPSGTSPGSTIYLTPAPTNGVTPHFVATITVPGSTAGTLTVFSASPTSGVDDVSFSFPVHVLQIHFKQCTRSKTAMPRSNLLRKIVPFVLTLC